MPSSICSYLQREEPQLFRFWEKLSPSQRKGLIKQLDSIRLDLLEQQRQLILAESTSSERVFEPFENYSFAGDPVHRQLGDDLIAQGRLGCLLLAGGQGTRLKHPGPKGTYPISLVKNKSLFQLCAEKVGAAGRKAGRPLPLAIMTSPENDNETRTFFRTHNFFGLEPSQVSFFMQSALPFLDCCGRPFLQSSDRLAEGPDGNGHSLLRFARAGILDNWLEQGVEFFHIILVDNPLANPFDAELLGFHCTKKNEITLKCTEKRDWDEKVGVLVKGDDSVRVVEYSELPQEEMKAVSKDGRLKHCCANLSLFCMSLSFIERIASEQKVLPLHKAWKAAPYADEEGKTVIPSQPNAWKFETFIFDWLRHSRKTGALLYPREQCFAPLKNGEGSDSPQTVQRALFEADRRTIQAITGITAPTTPFELAADFYYPTPLLLEKWKGGVIKSSFITP